MSGWIHKLRSLRQDFEASSLAGGPVIRTLPELEHIFPSVVWGFPSSNAGDPIHLTFDDGPAGDDTLRILEVLERHDINATFFLRGSCMQGEENTVETLLSRGHRIGYHGLTHESWWLRGGSSREVEMNPGLVPSLVPGYLNPRTGPLLLRAPFGRIDFATLGTVTALRARLVHWRLAIRDWIEGTSPLVLARALYRYTHPGDIVLLHDGGGNARSLARALDLVIPVWIQSGMVLSGIDPFLSPYRTCS